MSLLQSKSIDLKTNKKTDRRQVIRLQPQGTVEDYPPEALIDTITPDFSLPDDITDITKDSDTVDETSSGTLAFSVLFTSTL